jgi:hypothetical protein
MNLLGWSAAGAVGLIGCGIGGVDVGFISFGVSALIMLLAIVFVEYKA